MEAISDSADGLSQLLLLLPMNLSASIVPPKRSVSVSSRAQSTKR